MKYHTFYRVTPILVFELLTRFVKDKDAILKS